MWIPARDIFPGDMIGGILGGSVSTVVDTATDDVGNVALTVERAGCQRVLVRANPAHQFHVSTAVDRPFASGLVDRALSWD